MTAADELQGKSLKPFFASFKSEQTKDNYCIKLRQFLRLSSLDPDNFVELARKKPNKAEELLLDFVEARKKEGVGGSTIRMARDAIKLLLEMNDVESVNWKKINRVLPPARHHGSDRPPSSDEIRRLLLHADLKMKCVILLLVSSGIRVGALDYLTWGDLDPVKSSGFDFARLRVYSGEPEEYVTFVTPECYETLQEYRKTREDVGEKIARKSPLISLQLNERKIAKNVGTVIPRAVNSKVIRNKLGSLWKEMGLRDSPESTGKTPKHEFKQAHGFRKFFKSECERFVKSIYVEILMGHSTGVTASYMKPREEELAAEYAKAIPALTIMQPPKGISKEEVKRMHQESLLGLAGYTKEEIDGMDLESMSNEDIQRMARERFFGVASNNGKRVAVAMPQVDDFLLKGFKAEHNLPDGRVVMLPSF